MNKIVRVRMHKFFSLFKYYKNLVDLDMAYEVDLNAFSKEKDYQELKKLCDEYLQEIANVLKKYGFSNEYEVVKMFYLLLDSGLFSKDSTFTYRPAELRYFHISLLGARVMSGLADCKHCSQLASDFTKFFDFKTPPLLGNVIVRDDEGNITNYGSHTVTILSINGKKMLCDKSGNYLFANDESATAKATHMNAIFTSEGRQLTDSREILMLPSITEEELNTLDSMFYQKLANKTTKEAFYTDIFKVHLLSKEKLKRISEIEESYSLPKEEPKKRV